jgi:hypothetical protein
MAGRVVALAPPSLGARFAAAAAREPLCALSPAARAELAAVLEAAAELGDLPGKWQAALLAAEAGGARADPCRCSESGPGHPPPGAINPVS